MNLLTHNMSYWKRRVFCSFKTRLDFQLYFMFPEQAHHCLVQQAELQLLQQQPEPILLGCPIPASPGHCGTGWVPNSSLHHRISVSQTCGLLLREPGALALAKYLFLVGLSMLQKSKHQHWFQSSRIKLQYKPAAGWSLAAGNCVPLFQYLADRSISSRDRKVL